MQHTLEAGIFITIANVIYVLSYLVRDILRLRILTVIAGALLIPYYYSQPTPLWMPIGWGFIFMAINSVWIVRLNRDRRPVSLEGDAQRLHQLAFRVLSSRQMLKLVEAGSWEEIKQGSCLLRHDKELEKMSVILSGRSDIYVDDKKVGELEEGQFVGQIAFLSGGETQLSVIPTGPMKILTWDLVRLRSLLNGDKELYIAFETIVGRDLSKVLQQVLHRGE